MRWRLMLISGIVLATAGSAGCGIVMAIPRLIGGIFHVVDEADELKTNREKRDIELAQAQEDANTREMERRERSRDRSLPQGLVEPAASKIANDIAGEILADEYVAKHIERTNARMVLTTGSISSMAPHTSGTAVRSLSDRILGALSSHAAFKGYVDVIINRKEADDIMDREAGGNGRIFEDGSASPRSYDAREMVVLNLELREFDRPGETSWEVAYKVYNPKSRRFLVNGVHKIDQ